MPSSKDVYALMGATTFGVITLPPDAYDIDMPIIVPPGRTLDGCGSTFYVKPGVTAVVMDGDQCGVQRLKIQAYDVDGGRGKFGIVCHGSISFVEDVLVNGFDTGILFESGPPEALLYPDRIPHKWDGSDNCQVNRIQFWNCDIGIHVHGSDTNQGLGMSIYGQNTRWLVYDSALSGWMWKRVYLENGPEGTRTIVVKAASGTLLEGVGKQGGTLDGIGSDGPPGELLTSGVLILGHGLTYLGDAPRMRLDTYGLSQLQVNSDDFLAQAGILDGKIGMWMRCRGENQLTGMYSSDDIDGNEEGKLWPSGWYCWGYGRTRTVSLAVAGPLATWARWAGEARPAITPNGIVFGNPPMASTLYMGMATHAPTDGEWVDRDLLLTNQAAEAIPPEGGMITLGWQFIRGRWYRLSIFAKEEI